MTDWKQKIEAQIALYSMGGNCLPDVCAIRKANCCPCTATARTLKALLDVAVAAEGVTKASGYGGWDLQDAYAKLHKRLDKLREGGDD